MFVAHRIAAVRHHEKGPVIYCFIAIITVGSHHLIGICSLCTFEGTVRGVRGVITEPRN